MRRFLWLAALVLLCWGDLQAFAAPLSRPVKVILVISGNYRPYQQTLAATARGMEDQKLIANGNVPVPQLSEDLAPMWNWLCANAAGQTIKFLPDGLYSYSWDDMMRSWTRDEIARRLKESHDVGMVLTMGSDAGRDMVELVKGGPVVSLSSTNPIVAGIVKSAEDSGRDNVHSMVEPDRYTRQAKIFHELFGYQRLGVPYIDKEVRQYDIEGIKRVSKELGVKVFAQGYAHIQPKPEESFKNFFAVVRQMVEKDKVQALLLPYFQCPPELLDDFNDYIALHRIPTFSMIGSHAVHDGVLLGLSEANTSEVGQFEAQVLRQIVDGVKPRAINQVYRPQPTLVVNLATAKRIGWHIPFELLSSISQVYKTQGEAAGSR